MSLILFELVKSMTLNEKAYFRRNAKTHSSNEDKNYLKIYNVIENSKAFDKNTLSKHFKGTSVEKYLSSEISYLKEKILMSLFNFNLNKTKRNKIQKGILIIESLAAKGFQKEALKKLKGIKKIAIKQEEFTSILRLVELEEMLIFREGIISYKTNLELLHHQRYEIFNLIQNLNSYQILRQEIRELQFSNQLFSRDLADIKDFCNNPLILNGKNCMSIKAKEHWFYIQVLINYIKRDFSAGLDISFRYVEFMNKTLYLFDNNKVLPALSNYIFHAALNKNKEHFRRGEILLIEQSKLKESPQLYIQYILYTRSLEFAYYTNSISMTEEYITLATNLIENQFAYYEESQIQYLLMCIVRATIILKQYEIGAHYCNLWYQVGVLPYRSVQARLFSIIIHFELDYKDLIKSEIIILKKMEKKHLRDKALIQCFCKFINSILYNPEKRESAIKIFQKKLKLISKNNKGYFSFISFDYYQWSLGLS